MGRRKLIAFLTAVILVLGFSITVSAAAENSPSGTPGTALSGEIIVNGESIQAPAPYQNDAGLVMVPLRAVAEALGMNVLWNGDDSSVMLDGDYILWIGQDQYQYGTAPMYTMETAPVLVGERTYVPLSFFPFGIKGCDASVQNGSVTIDTSQNTAIWQEQDNIFVGAYDESLGSDSIGYNVSNQPLEVGKTAAGGDIYSFLRVPLGGEFTADEIQSARLFLKSAGDTVPGAIMVGTLTQPWNPVDMPLSASKGIVDEAGMRRAAVMPEDGGWVSIDVTGIVKAWINGEMPNDGFAFFPIDGENSFTADLYYFNTPYIEVTGQVGDRPTEYGEFGFTKQPPDGIAANPECGWNCLSYALRDMDGIFFDDLGLRYDDINRIYDESGQDGVAEYVAEHTEDYVNAHQAGLQISGFRKLGNYDSPIDPAKEYRIALRVGCYPENDLPLSEDNFDFHVWAQTGDGRWTQEFPGEYSEIIPGSGATASPDDMQWASARQWRSSTADFYRSRVIYFVVEKDTPDFTHHK